MAIVPRRTQEVSPSGIPSPSFNTPASLDALGGGEAAAAPVRSAQNLLGGMAQAHQELFLAEKKKADDLAIQDLSIEAGMVSNTIDQEIKNLRGKDALMAQDLLQDRWQKEVSRIKEKAANDTQRIAFDQIQRSRYSSLYSSAIQHSNTETKKYDDQQTRAAVDISRNEAINNAMDDGVVSLSLKNQRMVLEKYGERNGLAGSDYLKNEIFNAFSDTHVGIIEKRLSMGAIGSARNYYNAHKDEIAADKSVKFPEYIDAYEKRIKSLKDTAKKEQYDATLRSNMIAAFSGTLTMSELQRQFRNDETDVGDYTKMAHIVADPDFAFMRPDRLTDPAIFNEIREAQLSGSKGQGEILRMIRDAASEGKIVNNITGGKDVDYLIGLTKNIPPSQEERQTDAQAKNVRDFATRYFTDHEGFFRQRFQGEDYKKEKDSKVESMVSEFIRRVDNEKAKGERIDEIAKEVQGEYIKRDFPEVNRLEDLPHIIIAARRKIRRVLNPEQKSKLKAQYKIVPNKIDTMATKKSDKKSE